MTLQLQHHHRQPGKGGAILRGAGYARAHAGETQSAAPRPSGAQPLCLPTSVRLQSGLRSRSCPLPLPPLAVTAQAEGIPDDVWTLTALITAAERAPEGAGGGWQAAQAWFRNFTARGVAPNTVAYNRLIAVLGGGGQWQLALAALEAMRTSSSGGGCGGGNAQSDVGRRRGGRRQKQQGSASGTSEPLASSSAAMVAPGSAGCAPDVITYGTLIAALERAGQWQRALQLHEEVSPDTLVPASPPRTIRASVPLPPCSPAPASMPPPSDLPCRCTRRASRPMPTSSPLSSMPASAAAAFARLLLCSGACRWPHCTARCKRCIPAALPVPLPAVRQSASASVSRKPTRLRVCLLQELEGLPMGSATMVARKVRLWYMF